MLLHYKGYTDIFYVFFLHFVNLVDNAVIISKLQNQMQKPKVV